MIDTRPHITPLAYTDAVIATLDLPADTLTITRGIGSGLARRAGDAPGIFWAIGDRGPNLKVGPAVKIYGLTAVARHADTEGAKVMPRPDIGPALSELRIEGDAITLLRTLPLRGGSGAALSGLPTPGGATSVSEPAIALDGTILTPDPSGADTEGVAAAADGSFWVGDEYGPSLLRVAADGTVFARWVPSGTEALFAGADYPVIGALPAIAARRQINRGIEALALSDDGAWLYFAFQSPLAHPDAEAHHRARHVRIWKMDTATGAIAAQYLYPFDPPETFRRDCSLGKVDWSDLKISELVLLAPDRLLILERGSATTKLYAVQLDRAHETAPEQLDDATRPTLEQRSADGLIGDLALAKTLILDTDDLPEIDADLEGLIVLSAKTLLLVNDNDFGMEGVRTRFWRVELAADLPVDSISAGSI
ncbi:MAG: esterase-like activity of phytase family protein [Pseudomonadota bacterium]|uniref:esterase-like activity of phytase family protein n=1 Tax=Sphingomonas sp. ERG5 TaxID=1381597 RepID=UPI00068D856A|nr:esterase-like activity of phytase family protein [Sphingomonas sp. ERG5]